MAKFLFPSLSCVPIRFIDLNPVQLFMRFALYLEGNSSRSDALNCFTFYIVLLNKYKKANG